MGLEGFRTHFEDPGGSRRQRHGVRLRHRPPLGRQRRTRRLQNHGRRQNWRKVLAGANGSTGCAMLSMAAQTTEDDLRLDVGFPAPGVDVPLWAARQRTLQIHRWRRALDRDYAEQRQRISREAVRPHRSRSAPSKPQVVYAMVESKSSALFRSNDGGSNWEKLDASQYMVWRPFYFGNLIVDPKDENKIFKVDLAAAAQRERRQELQRCFRIGARRFSRCVDRSRTIPTRFCACDDGGLWRSLDGGTRWEHMMNLPVSQFYHVSVDNGRPVSRLWRPAGQQFVGRRLLLSRRRDQFALGKYVRRRRLLDVGRSRPIPTIFMPRRRAARSAA